MSILFKSVILNNQKVDVLVEDNIIAKIGNVDSADEIIDAKGEKAIVPGLYNMHSHAAMNLLRGYADDMDLMDWLQNKIWPLEAKLTEEDIYWGTKFAIMEMIKTGTVFFNDMYFFQEASIRAIEEMGIRAMIGMVIFDGSEASSPKTVEKNYGKFKDKNVMLAVAPHATYTVGKDNLKWASEFSKKNNLFFHMHLSESEEDVEKCVLETGKKQVEYLNDLGILNNKCIFAHGVWLSENERKLLNDNECSVVNNPVSNLKLASGIMNTKGIDNVLLGTDGASSNNSVDMFEEMKFCALLQKQKQNDPKYFDAQRVFDIASKNAAKVLGINGGEIKEGKLADFVLVDLNSLSMIPGYNIYSNLVYSANGDVVTDVVIDGKILYKDKKFLCCDEQEIIKKVREFKDEIHSRK